MTVVSMIGMAGYCFTGMDLVSAPSSTLADAAVVSDDGRSWGSNQNILKQWKENIYTELSDEEKKDLF